ncbi:putative ankyrin repeat and btb poz domain protein [Phaeomoniella chlamydospora]|uniref:Putative ankyrin repeat and btb poz domain protein n=1 Tax=Phaeomoniella chlamydospora TaxID=158046 RepID=A0A0G2DVI9_PHACM|nr:putative ankyrin repeat and btb poz domain protein [Phaeomoniella chlamydospora]
MSGAGLLRKDQLEISLHNEQKLIQDGVIKEDNPLDVSENFRRLCEACRRGDLKVCQEMIMEGVNINARDLYDYTPLILASLCGNYEVVELLLESGALCLYNALNDRIRNLLLSYDYSKSTDPLQPLAAHLTSLLTREYPKTADITVSSPNDSFHLHKFILSARSPYFYEKLKANPETPSWKLPSSLPPQAFGIAIKHLYLGELPRELGGGPGTGFTDLEVLAGADKISKHLEIKSLSQLILDSGDRRLARQKRQEEVKKGRDQLETWFKENVLKHKVVTNTSRADEIKWDRDNGLFADVLLRADEDEDDDEMHESHPNEARETQTSVLGIPRGPIGSSSRSLSRGPRKSVLFPCHRAMLIRSDYFLTMFSSSFKEAQNTEHLQIIPIDCSPEVLEIVLTFLYTEKTEFGLELAVDVLFAADLLFIEKLKTKAAVTISTLANGNATFIPSETPVEDIGLDIYEILRAAWLTRVQRLEEFAARYIAYRLEHYIDEPEFADIVKESASRISRREETDSIELLDDIRWYLSERFRLRFEDTGFEEMMEEEMAGAAAAASATRQEGGQAVTTEDKDNTSLPKWDSGQQEDEAIDMTSPPPPNFGNAQGFDEMLAAGAVRTLDGEIAGDELAADAANYQHLLGKIDGLLDRLKLDA